MNTEQVKGSTQEHGFLNPRNSEVSWGSREAYSNIMSPQHDNKVKGKFVDNRHCVTNNMQGKVALHSQTSLEGGNVNFPVDKPVANHDIGGKFELFPQAPVVSTHDDHATEIAHHIIQGASAIQRYGDSCLHHQTVIVKNCFKNPMDLGVYGQWE